VDVRQRLLEFSDARVRNFGAPEVEYLESRQSLWVENPEVLVRVARRDDAASRTDKNKASR
jgi:hypothetical protein